MDVSYPLSPFQAFAICVACMDGKIADRQGYEFLRRLTGQHTGKAGEPECSVKKDDKGEIFEDEVVGSRSVSRGSLSGSSIAETIPSRQYLADKFSRSFR
jgi:hypothetical protein